MPKYAARECSRQTRQSEHSKFHKSAAAEMPQAVSDILNGLTIATYTEKGLLTKGVIDKGVCDVGVGLVLKGLHVSAKCLHCKNSIRSSDVKARTKLTV